MTKRDDLETAMKHLSSSASDLLKAVKGLPAKKKKMKSKKNRKIKKNKAFGASSSSGDKCFNCYQPGICRNFGSCLYNQCICPTGFGGQDCSVSLCGSPLLAQESRPLKMESDADCACDKGFIGPNCNVCLNDDACKPMKGGAICQRDQQPWLANSGVCNITSSALYVVKSSSDSLQLTISRNASDGTAFLSFWLNQTPQMSCLLMGCAQLESSRWECSTTRCEGKIDSLFNASSTLVNLDKSANGSFLFACGSDPSACNAQFTFFSSLFPSGLPLAGCTFGECALPSSRIVSLKFPQSSILNITAVALAGILVLFLIAAFIWACVYKFFISPKSKAPPQAGPTILVHRLSYAAKHVGEVLREVSAVIPPAKITAILGPSGSGKTTLLDVLAGRSVPGRVRGALLYNGSRLPPHLLWPLVGYVRQRDNLDPILTVKETLLFHAALRCHPSVSLEERRSRVDQIMEDLGLIPLSDIRVGGAYLENAGPGICLSAGERRLVSIAIEVIRETPILVLDEPTNGMDSTTAKHVIGYLVQLTRARGTTIVLSIHQPRADLFVNFDEVLVLSSGSQLFSGPGSTASSYFRSRGFPCPAGQNVADHLLDVAMDVKEFDFAGRPVWKHGVGVGGGALIDTTTMYADVEKPLAVYEDQELAPSAAARIHLPTTSYKDKQPISPIDDDLALGGGDPSVFLPRRQSADDSDGMDQEEEGDLLWPPTHEYQSIPIGMWDQFFALANRRKVQFLRRPGLVVSHLIVAVLCGIFVAIFFVGSEDTVPTFQARLGTFTFLLAFTGLAGLTSIMFLATDFELYKEQRLCGYYSTGALYLSTVVYDLAFLRVLPAIIISTLTLFLVGVSSGPSHFLIHLCIIFLFSFQSALLSACIYLVCLEPSVSVLISSTINLWMLLFSGFLISQDLIPPHLQWMKFLSFYFYSYEAMMATDLLDPSVSDSVFGRSFNMGDSAVIARYGFRIENYERDMIISTSLTVIFLIVIYLLLQRK